MQVSAPVSQELCAIAGAVSEQAFWVVSLLSQELARFSSLAFSARPVPPLWMA